MAACDDFYEQAVEEAVEVLAAKQGESTLNFVFITDIHHIRAGRQLRAARAVRELAARLPLDFVLNGGDLGINFDKRSTLAAQSEMIEALRVPGIPLLTAKGNHDDNSIFGNERREGRADHVIFPVETKALIREGLLQWARWDESNPDGLYYYVDVEEKRTRVIVLDTTDVSYALGSDGCIQQHGQWDYAFSPRQLIWLAQEALRMPERSDWRVLIASHVAIVQDGVLGADYPVANGEALWEIVKAFSRGSSYAAFVGEGHAACRVEADYTDQGKGTVVGCLFGHVHCDQAVYRDGIPMVSSLNASTVREFADSPEREAGTLSETAFDIVTVDFRRACIDCYRFGAGAHRTLPF